MLSLNLDLGPLMDLNNNLKPKIDEALKNAAQSLAMQAHAHILENVQDKLHSTRQQYADALGFQQVNDSTWIVSLDTSAMWIEEGMPEHSMLDNLLRSPKAKMAKDGSRYLVVPFKHSKPATQQTTAATDLTNTIKRELKNRQIPFGSVERDDKGQAKLGLLHSFDITKEPVKTHDGPGQGHGPIGSVRQGNTGIPFLQNVRIYQRNVGGSVQRDIMTFRVASSKHKGTGKWMHPGLEARHFFDEAADWSLELWDKIRDQILKDFNQL